MYNRYVPQNDGSHRRNTVNTNKPRQNEDNKNYHNPPPPPPPTAPCSPPAKEFPKQKESAGSFLKGLLPKNLDTGDLLIIILLLLLAGDNQDEKNSALLTLAIYLFM